VAAAVAVLLLLGGCGTAGPAAETAPAATTAVSPDFNSADVTFVRALIPHHRAGVALAEAGAARADRAEVRMLAGAIVSTQEDEARRMAGWLTTWQQPPAPTPAPTHVSRPPAADFDRTFVRALIDHQQEAIGLAETETAAGRNRNAVAFARQVVESRTAQIDQLRGYLAG
jgi:uncharacterized protein (DUF305 family)